MDTEALMSDLLDSGVIETDPDHDGVYLTEPFEKTIQRIRNTSQSEITDGVSPAVFDAHEETIEGLCEIEGCEEHIGPEFLALAEFMDGAETDRLLNVAVVVNQFTPEFPPADGCPDQFIPIHGDRIDLIARIFRHVIVYVWRHECPPCDLVRQDLDDIVTESNTPLIAVYGPDWAERLKDRYDVDGGPTTLFFIDGEIDMRLQGAYPKETLQSVLEEFTAGISVV